MFYALAIALCLAVLFLILASGLLLLLPGMRILERALHSRSSETAANALFAARVLPLGTAFAVTLGLALPAFLAFEPHATKEGIGLRLTVLAFLGGSALVMMTVRGWRILQGTRRIQRTWGEHSQRMQVDGLDLQIYRVENDPSLLAVTGIFRPRIFVSKEITGTLSADELRAALAHEAAHVSSFDNLKQFLLMVTRPPKWIRPFQNMDASWVSASELAADQSALLQGASVVNLSSALIKVGRLKRAFAGAEVLASHLVPGISGSSLEMRVRCLSKMLEQEQQPVPAAKKVRLAVPIFLAMMAYLACIHAALPAIHEALEFLVR